MKNDVKKIRAADGSSVEFVEKSNPPAGAMKFVFFSPGKDYVVAFFKKPLDTLQRVRLERIAGKYRHDIFTKAGGDYWRQLFCWPEKLVEWEGRLGFVAPAYSQDFFFRKDPQRLGVEKDGKWFASAKLLRLVAAEEQGNFFNFLRICLKLSQAVRRLHAAGLAHSDLSYKNVLIDPCAGKACVIDIDGLVVPGKYPPDVLGTQDFIAPEVIVTRNLPPDQRILPSQATDRHALAVLIYMYLLHRHPLRGGRFFGPDVDDEENMLLGTSPLFIEHPTDRKNRNMKREYGQREYQKYLPWIDLQKFSAPRICGPYLWKLFQQAFIDGLIEPPKRPIANDWEIALLQTFNMILRCSNQKCPQRFFVADNSNRPKCPFCETEYKEPLLILNFYTIQKNTWRKDNSKLMVWDGLSLFKWHVCKNIFPNEKLQQDDKSRVGFFQFFQGNWILYNEKILDMYEIMKDGGKRKIEPGTFVILADKTRILLSDCENGRLAVVQVSR